MDFEPGIEGRELRDPAPDAVKRAEDRVVALVKGRVGLGAEPLNPIGVGQNVAGADKLLVFTGLRVDALNLPEFEAQPFLAAGPF